jgi:hypothetical protein
MVGLFEDDCGVGIVISEARIWNSAWIVNDLEITSQLKMHMPRFRAFLECARENHAQVSHQVDLGLF